MLLDYQAEAAEAEWHKGCRTHAASAEWACFAQLVPPLLDDEACATDGNAVAASFGTGVLRHLVF